MQHLLFKYKHILILPDTILLPNARIETWGSVHLSCSVYKSITFENFIPALGILLGYAQTIIHVYNYLSTVALTEYNYLDLGLKYSHMEDTDNPTGLLHTYWTIS